MSPRTLFELANRTAIRNIAHITSLANMPYTLITEIIRKFDSPRQLRLIETTAPAVAEHDGWIWKEFIARDIPGWEEKIFEPPQPDQWWRVYKTLMYREMAEKELQEKALRQRLTTAGSKESRGEVKYVQEVLPLPRKQSAYVDGKPNPRLTESGAVRKVNTRNARNGIEYVRALRREGAEAHKMKTLAMTRPLIPDAKSQIQQAPQSMVDEVLKQRGAIPHNSINTDAFNWAWNSAAPKRSDATKIFPPKASNPEIVRVPRPIDDVILKRIQEKKEKEQLKALALAQSKNEDPATVDESVGKGISQELLSPEEDPLCLMNLWKTETPVTKPVSPPKITETSTPTESPSKITGASTPAKSPLKLTGASASAQNIPARSMQASAPSPPVVIKKRAAATSVFMPGNKKRKI